MMKLLGNIKMDYAEVERLCFRLKEADLGTKRFLKVGDGKLHFDNQKYPKGVYTDKAAFETDFTNNLYDYTQATFETWSRWGLLAGNYLVLLDFDKQEIYDIIRKRLKEVGLETFEVTSPRHKLPHLYLIVWTKENQKVPNLKFHIPGDTYVNEKGATVRNPSGEIRADNYYTVAPGATIRYQDIETKEWKVGKYIITNDVKIAGIEYDDFMKVLDGYLMEKAGERVLTDEKLTNGVSVGERHDTIFRYACRLVGDNSEGRYPAKIALDILTRFNNELLTDENGELAPVEESFLPRVIRQGCEYTAKDTGIPVNTIAELGLTVIREREGKGESFKAKDGILEPEVRKDVQNNQVNDFLTAGYTVEKQYETHAILIKKAITTTEKKDIKDTDKPMESQADRLIKYLLAQDIELFYDQHTNAYVKVKMTLRDCAIARVPESFSPPLTKENESKEDRASPKEPQTSQIAQLRNINVIISLGSSQFKNYLAYLFWQSEQKTPGSDALTAAINVLKGKAQNEGKQYRLYNRVAPAENGIWLDMCDAAYRALKITKDGWEIVNDPPILFRRYNHQQPLIEPLDPAKGDAWKLLDYVNIQKTDTNSRLMLLVSAISYLIPNIAHPNIVTSGAQGCCKSYLFMFVRRLCDPSSVELLRIPKAEEELALQLEHHWVLPYDNISYLPGWASDVLCCAITGGGIEKRKLYTDDDAVIYQFKRCVMLNGINIVAQRGDLLDRSILFKLEVPSQENRKTEKELNAAFDKDKAIIFTGFLNVLSSALKKLPIIELEKRSKQRLSDFDVYGCAIAEALGNTQKEFTDAYAEKVKKQNEEALNADPVALALLRFVEKEVKGNKEMMANGEIGTDYWKATPTDLYLKVNIHAQAMGVDVKSKTWPKNANALTRRLNLAIPALKAQGVVIESFEGNPRKISIDAHNLKVEKPDPPKPLETEKEPKHYCSQECGNYENPNQQCPKYGNLNQFSEMPCRCPSRIDPKPKVKKKYVCEKCGYEYFRKPSDGQCNVSQDDGVCGGQLRKEEF